LRESPNRKFYKSDVLHSPRATTRISDASFVAVDFALLRPAHSRQCVVNIPISYSSLITLPAFRGLRNADGRRSVVIRNDGIEGCEFVIFVTRVGRDPFKGVQYLNSDFKDLFPVRS
jgi:hypothetical protein